MVELLAASREPRGVTDIARTLGISKPRVHRHLRALVDRGYARQDPITERYEVGIKVLALGEDVRDRFDVATAARPVMGRLRDVTTQTVTIAALVERQVVVLDLLRGATFDFGLRSGSVLGFHSSAHGLLALAFGPPGLLEATVSRPLEAPANQAELSPEALRCRIDQIREQGWATAADQVLVGVNALAAPVFDHRGVLRGSIAIVGLTQFIPEAPEGKLIEAVLSAAREASEHLGWRGSPP